MVYVLLMTFVIKLHHAALTQWRISLRMWKFEIRGKFAENDTIGLEKYWKIWGFTKWLRMLANCLRMPLQILRMLPNALASACECLPNETTTQRMHCELHINHLAMLNCFTLSLIRQPPPCESCECLQMPLPILRMPLRILGTLAIAYENVAKTMRIIYSPGI
jgi:hypothetical protein